MAESVQEIEVPKLEGSVKGNDVKVCDDNCKDKAKIPWFFERKYDQFFQYHGLKSEKTFLVKCLACPSKLLSVTVNSASNLKSHFQSVHGSIFNDFLDKTKKRKASEDDDEVIPTKQQKITMYTKSRVVNQAQLNVLVFDYIMEGMCPFVTVEKPSFKRLVLTGKSDELHVMSRKSLVQMLSKEFQLLKDGLTEEFSKIEYFCLTTDIWTSHRRAFLGMTIHWICPKAFSRKENALACKRIKGAHTSDVVALHIDEVIKLYSIALHKILKIITDGGSNFKKAFKEYQVDNKENQDIHNGDDENDYTLTDLLNENQCKNNVLLPPHATCASHGLSLVLTSDTKTRPKKKKKENENVHRKEKVLTAEQIEQQRFQEEFYVFRETRLDPVLKKCQALFNKQERSAKAADLIKSHLNRYLVTPADTRWNSFYDSVVVLSELLDSKPVEIVKIFAAFGLEKIQPHEHVVLKEYIKITESVADALDILQGEQYMYTGVYAPTLYQLKDKVNKISGLKYCAILKEMILRSINQRFPDATNDEYLMASLLHPLFKTFPMFTPEVKSRIINKIVVELQHQIDDNIPTSITDNLVKNRSDISNLKTFKKLFDFDDTHGFAGSSTSSSVSTVAAETLLHNYLIYEDNSIKSLEKFPEIAKLFIKTNTVLCSSAPSERLFSLAKHIFEADRISLTDINFESQLLYKANSYKK